MRRHLARWRVTTAYLTLGTMIVTALAIGESLKG